MDATRSGDGGLTALALLICPLVVGGRPISSNESPLPSLKRDRTSSERGSPGRTQPRLRSELLRVFGLDVGLLYSVIFELGDHWVSVRQGK